MTQDAPKPQQPEPIINSELDPINPTPRTVEWENSRVAAILEAAAKCFARRGFNATTLAEIGQELGLRKSIVHYYFTSKTALIHEVQSYTDFKYLSRVRRAVPRDGNATKERSAKGIAALWEASTNGGAGINVEVWSALRTDDELKRRAVLLQKEKRQLVAQGIADMLGADPSRIRESLCTLVLGVLNGLAVCEYIEGEGAKTQEAFEVFISLLRAGLQNLDSPQSQAQAQPQPAQPQQPHPHPG